MPETPEHSALGGAIERRDDGWHWTDTGDLETCARDLLLRHIGMNLRCNTLGGQTYVEVPSYWRDLTSEPEIIEAVTQLIAEHGQRSQIYAEGVAEAWDDHRLRNAGWLVPIRPWDAVMRRVVGGQWDDGDEPALLARAGMIRENGRLING